MSILKLAGEEVRLPYVQGYPIHGKEGPSVRAAADSRGYSSPIGQQTRAWLSGMGLPVEYYGMQPTPGVLRSSFSNPGWVKLPEMDERKITNKNATPTFSLGPWNEHRYARKLAYNKNLTPEQNDALFNELLRRKKAARKDWYEKHNTDDPATQQRYARGELEYPFFLSSSKNPQRFDPNKPMRVYPKHVGKFLGGFAGTEYSGAPFMVADPRLPFTSAHEGAYHAETFPFVASGKNHRTFITEYAAPRSKIPGQGRAYADFNAQERSRADRASALYAMRNFGKIPNSWEEFEDMYNAGVKANPALAADTDPQLYKNRIKNFKNPDAPPLPEPPSYEGDHENIFNREFKLNKFFRQYDQDVNSGKRKRDPKIDKMREWRNGNYRRADTRTISNGNTRIV